MAKYCIRYLAPMITGFLFTWFYLQMSESKVYKNGIVKSALGLMSSQPLSKETRLLKVYIYPLDPKFNNDIKDCDFNPYYRFLHVNNYGFGDLMYEDGELGIYDTHQFSLEVVLHEQLLHSQYQTDDASEADIFYIPSYLGLASLCFTLRNSIVSLQNELFKEIQLFPFFDQGRPHVSALAKIEGEEYSLLQNPHCRNVTYVVIEKEANQSIRDSFKFQSKSIIVAPYPSYAHREYINGNHYEIVTSATLQQRHILLFLAAGDNKLNNFRKQVLNQFKVQIAGKSYGDYLKANNVSLPPEQLMLLTREFYHDHNNITIDWMHRSVFCLQPYGDSPTRKSFYDSIQSGCIPVIFKYPNESVEYPFQNVLNYTDFVVSVDSKRIINKENILDIVKEIPPKEIHRLHNNILLVARKLQYSVPTKVPKPSTFIDALDMIIQQVAQIYHL